VNGVAGGSGFVRSNNGFDQGPTSSRSMLNNNQTVPRSSSTAAVGGVSSTFPISNITRVGQSMTIPKGQVPPELAATLNDTSRIFSSYPRGAPRGGGAGAGGIIGRKRERSRSRTRSPSSLAGDERSYRGRAREPRGLVASAGRGGGGARGSSFETSPPSINRSIHSSRGRSPLGKAGSGTSERREERDRDRDTGSHSATSTAATASHKSTLSDPSTLTSKQMIEEYNLPGIHKNTSSISISDLILKYPKLYIPADFTDFKLDWQSINIGSTYYDFFFNLSLTVPIVFENTPVTMKPTATVSTVEATSKQVGEGAEAETTQQQVEVDSTTTEGEKHEQQTVKEDTDDLSHKEAAAAASTTTAATTIVSTSCHSDILEPAKFSYVTANTANNIITKEGIPYFPERFHNHEKPIKFNAKVLVCCGLKDPETERIDHNFTRKLRFDFFLFSTFSFLL
jgi:hypothetical protein